MQSTFEHFALGSLLGQPDAPPKDNGSLCFAFPWERKAFGIALALARDGVLDWEDFRVEMIASIAEWEAAHDLIDPNWNYYEVWLTVLERMLVKANVADKQA